MGIAIRPPGPADPVTPTASLMNRGTATGPAAGQVIAVINVPPPGVYHVRIYLSLSGTITAAEQDNMKLLVNSVVLTNLPVDAVAETVNVSPVIECDVSVPAGNISVQAIAAAGVAAVYSCFLVATRTG
jgi:hypothetical protein